MSDWWLKIARDLGKAVGEFQKAVEEVHEPIEQAAKDVRDGLSEPPLLVFVSSIMNPTCDDLVAERAAAKKAIEALPSSRAWLFEYSPASPETAPRVYLRQVKECDIFVLVLGKEITYPVLREYATARKHTRWRLAFLKKCERTPATRRFVGKIGNEVKWQDFGAANDLAKQIQIAIVDLLLLKFRDKLTANEIVVLTALLSQLTKPEVPLPAQPTEPALSEPRIEVSTPKPPRVEKPDSLFSPTYKYGKDGKRMILIPAGEFWRGTSDADILEMNLRFDGKTDWFENQKPQCKIYLDAYYIDETPVTNEEYKRFVDATGHPVPHSWDENRRICPPGKENHPVVHVSWDDANAYARWAGKQLPTEAQWEKAARGTDGRWYPWGNEQPDTSHCNFDNNEKGSTPIGKYSPQGDSPYHLQDMAGNVWEWCSDWYDARCYEHSVDHNPTGPSSGSLRVLRGGSWVDEGDLVRCAFRGWREPDAEGWKFGFRTVVAPVRH